MKNRFLRFCGLLILLILVSCQSDFSTFTGQWFWVNHGTDELPVRGMIYFLNNGSYYLEINGEASPARLWELDQKVNLTTLGEFWHYPDDLDPPEDLICQYEIVNKNSILLKPIGETFSIELIRAE